MCPIWSHPSRLTITVPGSTVHAYPRLSTTSKNFPLWRGISHGSFNVQSRDMAVSYPGLGPRGFPEYGGTSSVSLTDNQVQTGHHLLKTACLTAIFSAVSRAAFFLLPSFYPAIPIVLDPARA